MEPGTEHLKAMYDLDDVENDDDPSLQFLENLQAMQNVVEDDHVDGSDEDDELDEDVLHEDPNKLVAEIDINTVDTAKLEEEVEGLENLDINLEAELEQDVIERVDAGGDALKVDLDEENQTEEA